MNPDKLKHWRKFCDELVIVSENDQELKEGLAWLDEQAQKKGVSFYEMLWNVLMVDPLSNIERLGRFDDEMGGFMQSLTRKYK